nr:hypothetical protein [Planococcus glaciei]
MIHVKETTDKTGNTGARPEAFIRNDQFNFIKDQTRILVTGQATGNDAEVLSVLRHLAHEKVFKLFPSLTAEQKAVLNPLASVKEKADAEAFLAQLEPYIIPFKAVTDAALKKLFPKAKKAERAEVREHRFQETVVPRLDRKLESDVPCLRKRRPPGRHTRLFDAQP